MNVSQLVAQRLDEWGVAHVFTLSGGMIAPLLDAIHRHGRSQLVTLHHEQAVAFAVDGWAHFNRRPAVGLATSGPGATNLLTGIASCHLDSVPALFVTGQVQSYLIKGERPVRSFGLQECDFPAIAAPVVKAAMRLQAPEEAAATLDEAFALTTEGRPGPVVLEIPVDIQSMPVPEASGSRRAARSATPAPDRGEVGRWLDTLEQAERPLILAGGGIRAALAEFACSEFVRRVRIPLAASQSALDVLPGGDPMRLGMVGMYGNRWVNLAIAEADTVLVLGSRLDLGTIGADVAWMGRGRTILQVDCDPAEMRRVRGIRSIRADLGEFLEVALELSAGRRFSGRPGWLARLRYLEEASPDTEELAGCPGINPNVLMRQLSAHASAAAAFVIDAGQHGWWACQSIRPEEHQRVLTSMGFAACGYSLPAAIGVAFASSKPVVMVVGDGALQFNIQELQTVVRNQLPIKIVVLNNRCHGSVRQLQERLFEERYPASVSGYDVPDFKRVAAAYGIPSRTVTESHDAEEALRWLWGDPWQAALLQVMIQPELGIYPNVAFGSPLSEMASWSGRRPAVSASMVQG